jgi:hypothetical protein
MALADGMMAQGATLLTSVLGEPIAGIYKTPTGVDISCNAIIGRERGGIRHNHQTGDVEKVIRKLVKIPTGQLTAKGVTGLQQFAVFVIDGRTWPVDLTESAWGVGFVKLMLVLSETARNEQLRGTV